MDKIQITKTSKKYLSRPRRWRYLELSCALFELLNDMHMSESPTNVIIYEMPTNSVLTNLIYASWIIFNFNFMN